MTSSGPIRALVAVGSEGTAIVLAHNSEYLAGDMEAINDIVDEIGIGNPPATFDGKECVLWLWEGTAKATDHTAHGGDFDVYYSGVYRPVWPDELAELLAMVPPESEEPR